jgi:hypothetical protein
MVYGYTAFAFGGKKVDVTGETMYTAKMKALVLLGMDKAFEGQVAMVLTTKNGLPVTKVAVN